MDQRMVFEPGDLPLLSLLLEEDHLLADSPTASVVGGGGTRGAAAAAARAATGAAAATTAAAAAAAAVAGAAPGPFVKAEQPSSAPPTPQHAPARAVSCEPKTRTRSGGGSCARARACAPGPAEARAGAAASSNGASSNAAGAGAAGPAAAGGPEQQQQQPQPSPSPPPAPRVGRPPKIGASYSRRYQSTKSYRERRRAAAGGLAEEVARKLAELELLTAENQMLRLREEILSETLAGLEAGAAGTAPPPGLPNPSVAAAAAALADAYPAREAPPPPQQQQPKQQQQQQPQQQQQQQQQQPPLRVLQPIPSPLVTEQAQRSQRAQHSGLAAQAQAAVRAVAADGDDDPLAGRSAAYVSVVNLYREYIRRVRARVQPDGSVRPLLPGEEQYPQHRTIVSLYMSMTQEECFQVLVTNMETGRVVDQLPPGAVARAAEHLHLCPEQAARIGATLDTLFEGLKRLWDERAELQERLSAMLLPGAGESPLSSGVGGGEGGVDLAEALLQREEVLSMLRANMVREDRMCSTVSFMFMRMVDEVQRATCILHCWPFTPRFTQMCALKLGRKEVIEKIGLSMAMRRSNAPGPPAGASAAGEPGA